MRRSEVRRGNDVSAMVRGSQGWCEDSMKGGLTTHRLVRRE